jgi:D-alanyl-D-alanine carboxypeptidase
MKKWVFWLVILILLGYGFAQHKLNVVKENPMDEDNLAQEVTIQKNEKMLKVTKAQIYKGNLLLVNKDHPVPPDGEQSDAVNLFQHKELMQGFIVLDKTIKLSPSLVHKFSTMIGAAANDGVSRFMISSGYRDNKEQDQLYQQMGADRALPAGYSEHNLGLSLDIGSTQGEMNQAPEGNWLKKNAWKYGFILRYPADKTAITGIQSEPWHFRYVGLPHSAIMQEKNLVLEQYLDYLKEQKTITATVDDQNYKISYYPVSKTTTIPVPAKGHYEISGNNMDGVIETEYSS